MPGQGNINGNGKIIAAAQQFAGPIPHPEIFRQYGEVVPDAPERILGVFEKDSQHTRDIQMAALNAEVARDSRTCSMDVFYYNARCARDYGFCCKMWKHCFWYHC